MKDLVVKTNKLNSAIQNLSLAEIRVVQIGIVDARETGNGLSISNPLRITAKRYAEVFNTSYRNAYDRLRDAEETLFNRRFSFIDTDGNPVKSRWIQQVKYFHNEGFIEVVFTEAVVREITRLDGKQTEQFFTKYMVENTSEMKSNYSVRLYELLVQWKEAARTPLFDLEIFRKQLGVGVDEYKQMSNFKIRVLDIAVKEINEKSDLKISYTQEKKGRTIVGFKFTVKTREAKITTVMKGRDKKTVDMFNGLTDSQLERVTRSQKFMSDYGYLVHSNSPANRSMKDWTFEMVKKIKEDPRKFTKRPMQEYLDDEPAKSF